VSGAGQAIAQGLQQWQQNRAESQFLDQQAETLARVIAPRVAQGTGNFDPKIIDDLAKFPGMSVSAKRGKLAGLQFLLDQDQKASEAAATQKRHDDEMGARRAGLELQRGQLLAGEVRQQRSADREAAVSRDTLAMLLGMSGQTQLPGPVDPNAPGAYLAQEYPNADPKVIEGLLKDMTPAAKARLDIDRGNLEVARDQVENRRTQVDNQAKQVGRTTLTPSALASFQKAKADLRMTQAVTRDDAERAAIQADIDQLDALMAESMPAKPGETPAPARGAPKKYNPTARKLE
jgi:hypothetical protein